MFSHDHSFPALQSDFDAWGEAFRSITARYNLEHTGKGDFAGWTRALSGFGFQATDVGFNLLTGLDRTHHDASSDQVDDFAALIQITGSATVSQNDSIVQMAPGHVILHDMARPVAARFEGGGHWFGLYLPRQTLISRLGFAPTGGQLAQGGPRAGRLLHEMALCALYGEDISFSLADEYLQLAVYDLVGALFAQDSWPSLRPTDKLFNLLRRIIDNNFTDPDFGPQELATEAGISLRYVHKLFAQRGSACTAYIYARRLEHAAQSMRRRSFLATGQPLREIAYACGFRCQTLFTRKFRRRFGSTPRDYIASLRNS